jgi:hypothetical protein
MQHYQPIHDLLTRVRRRWRALCAMHAVVRGALTASAVIIVAVLAARWTIGAPVVLMLLAGVALLSAAGAMTWCLIPLRRVPADGKVARYIEERAPALDDRLVTAVDVAHAKQPPAFAEQMIGDAARRTSDIDIDTIVPAESLRRAAFQAAAALIVLGVALLFARGPASQAADAASLTLFPERVTLDVSPGHARIKAGSPLAIHAQLVGNRAPVIAQVQIADGDRWRRAEMSSDQPGSFRLAMPSVSSSFRYRVVAGAVTSPTYDVSVAFPPRVTRIDVDYSYPAALRLEPRTEADSGDIYAPAGTDVRVHVFTDRPAATGSMALGDGKQIPLTAAKSNEFTTTLRVTDDNSYRIALADPDGFASPGDTEYFIRTLEDRPPEVRVLKPATDRSVTRLEEVDVEAQAEDDYGIDRLDLVYSVRGGAEKVVPLAIERKSAMVNGHHTLYLEDLNVQPGDFVSYYVRARDVTRGTRPNEARSDIFFLEVKPYEQEFSLAQSQGGMPGGGQGSIDDLVTAQKEIVVATWKLDRRGRSANGAKSETDIKSVSKAETELKTRVEQTASTFRESTMRDPRRRQPQRGRGPQPPAPPPPTTPELKVGETLPEEDHMTAAATAMGKAVVSLDALKTADALPPEMEALNHLLKAQADVKKREVMRQQAGSGSGNNRSNYDMSSLFDKELQKQQETNYENKSSTAESKEDSNQSALDKIKDLARRQDELLKKQDELARKRAEMSEEELKRELEKLTRDQSELRQKAEELARQMGQQSASQQASSGQQQDDKQGEKGQQGQKGQSGRQGQGGQSGQQSSPGSQQTPSGGQQGENSKRMRDVSEEMRSAASELRRQDPGQASARGNRALEKLRELQQQLEAGRPDERRRALGEMQLEARQLADAQRQIAAELGKTAQGEAGKDAVRRLAGEEERLAERARKLQDALKQQAAANGAGPRGAAGAKGNDATKTTAGDAAKQLERERVTERMQQTADAIRGAAAEESKAARGNTAPRSSDDPRSQAAPAAELARALDKVADKLSSASGARDDETQKLSDQRARAQELRDKLAETSREIERMGRAGQQGQTGEAGRAGQAGRSGEPGQPGQSGRAGETASGGQSGQSGRSGQNAQGGQGQAQGSSAGQSAGESGRSGEGQAGGGGSAADLEKLREQYQRQLRETKDFVDQMRRDDPSLTRGGGGGFTFEAPTSSGISAPGTEAFKQDFAKWEEMRRQATQALDNVESSLSKKIQEKQAKDRLAAGADDNAPAGYEKQVDSYFKAIAGKKKP